MSHRRLEGEAEAILAGVRQKVDRVGDRGFRRQLLAQNVGKGGRQGAAEALVILDRFDVM